VITPDTIDRVRDAADIVQVIGEHVSLKKMGKDWRGPCPFHQGKNRNFSVSPQKGMYYCFVCHESGDVFTFVQKRLGLDWPGAVRFVAEKAGVEVREIAGRVDEPDEREPLWEATAAAAEYFRSQLWEGETGREARAYLGTRGITQEVADRFGLGFAPRDPSAMRVSLNQLGYDDARLLAAGLLLQRAETGEVRPRFRGRLMFPILDARGRAVGFGGRVVGEGEPKYLNSAESRIFDKSRLLYGLHLARQAIRREGRVLVVEGYFDVIRVAAAGTEWVVAPLGTALTDAQAEILQRLTKNVFLLYDGDSAGLRATFRSGDELLRRGVSVQVVTLPDGEDPDTYVARFGGERLLGHVGAAVDVFERKLQVLERGGWFADLRRKRRALDRLLPTIRVTADPLTKDIYLARAAEVAGVGKELLAREASVGRGPGAVVGDVGGADGAGGHRDERPEDRRARGDRRRSGAGRRAVRSGSVAERTLLQVVLHHRVLLDALVDRLGPDDLEEPLHRELFRAVLGVGGEGSVEALAQAVSPDAGRLLQELLDEPTAAEGVDVQRVVDDCLAALRVRVIRRQLAEIDRLMPLAGDDEKTGMIRDKMVLRDEIRALGGRGYPHYGKAGS
jgi:DNA primase